MALKLLWRNRLSDVCECFVQFLFIVLTLFRKQLCYPHPLLEILAELHLLVFVFVFFNFFLVNVAVKQSPVLIFHNTQIIYQEIRVKCFSLLFIHNNVHTGIEPVSVRSITQRLNQEFLNQGSWNSKGSVN